MKKSLKSLALVLAVVLLVSVFPFSAFAANLNKYENQASNAEYYNILLQNASTPDEYIAFQYTGVDKNTKTLTVMENEPITITMDDGNGYTGANWTSSGHSLGWYYSSGSNRSISTDAAFTMTDGNHTFAVSGFGTAENQNSVTAENGKTAKTTFTLDSGLQAGDYEFTVTYKYQMKKYTSGWFGGWDTQQELSTSDVIKIHVEKNVPQEYYPNTKGGTIRVGNVPGLRFGFTTDADASTITDYGFLYSYSATDSLVEGAQGVYKVNNANHVTYDEGTDAEYTEFNLVFTDVPSSAYDTSVTACSYVVIDGETYYSEPVTRTFRGVANSVLADETVDDATKDAVRELLAK